MASFDSFISKNYPGLNFLSVSLEINTPGVILNDDDRVIDGLSHIFPDKSQTCWTTKTVDCDIPGQTISGTRDLSIGLTILGIFTLKGGVSSKYSVAFEFGAATALVFDTNNGGIFENDARGWIKDLKHQDRSRWKDILHEFVVMESIYVESVSVEFTRDGKVLTDVDLPVVKNEISVNGSYTWNAGGKLVIQDNKVPFGVRGFLVKRAM